MASLSYRSAAKIAAREMRSSRGKFLFVLLSVAIGVAALTGVRGFSASFRTTLLMRARSIMAADLAARMFQQSTPGQQQGLDEIRATGVQITTVTEMLSMASSPKSMDPILVAVKAVDPALYPFYGEVELSPASGLKSALGPHSVAAATRPSCGRRSKGGRTVVPHRRVRRERARPSLRKLRRRSARVDVARRVGVNRPARTRQSCERALPVQAPAAIRWPARIGHSDRGPEGAPRNSAPRGAVDRLPRGQPYRDAGARPREASYSLFLGCSVVG